nr:Amylo-alpha-1 domain containing protein [Haemonchus contortus]
MAPVSDDWTALLTLLAGDVTDMGTTKQPQIRIIVLEKGENLTNVIRRLEKGDFVRFHRGGSLLGVEVQIRTSLTGDEPLKWTSGTNHLAVYCQVECTRAGSFKYTFTADDEEAGSGYFLVMPELTVSGKRLPLDGITCQTHLTKLLGSFSNWEDRLRVAKESGYNMIHLTPIHELGVSNSSYSLSNHHALIQTIQEDNHQVTFDDVEKFVQKIEKEWNMLTVQDVVWNHAAKNAQWLQEHPECAYNCSNSPHLRPAFVVDRVYHHFGREVGEGKWISRGIPEVVDNIHHCNAIEYILRTEVLPKIRLHEFFQVDVDETVRRFEEMARGGATSEPLDEVLQIAQDPEYRRFGSSVDWSKAMRIFNRHRDDATSEDDRLQKCSSAFRDHLHYLNGEAGKEAWEIVMSGLRAMMGHIHYQRLADDGPKLGAVTPKNPLTTDYFLMNDPKTSWEEEEWFAYDPDKSRFLMAFNGWVMSSNPLKNFALPDSQVYLRRELVCWGDSIKLNYRDKPEDCPFLWQYMREYTEKCARMFHGLRIDNAHSTPIHVAEYLLLAAREIRPDIYVFAELFTGSEESDNMFVNRLGISSLIREAQAAYDSHEQGRLVYKYGGDVVGAMIQKPVRPAPQSVAHAIFLDQSHDNPCPIESRSVYDLLPTAAMVSMASCASGSVRGYDELVRHQIHVVKEKRPYAKWGSETTYNTGIVEARRILNDLHLTLARANYTQVFVDQMSPDVVGITRHNPITHDTVFIVAHTAFNKHHINKDRVYLKNIPIGGILEDILFEMRIDEESPEWNPENPDVLTGLTNYKVHIRQYVPPEKAKMCVVHGNVNGFIELTNFPSGSVIGFRVRLTENARTSIGTIRAVIAGNAELEKELAFVLDSITLQDFNRLFFMTDAEERVTVGHGTYYVPRFGQLVYCGLQGLIPLLNQIRVNNDLGHPLCANLRDGTWLCEYVSARLERYPGLIYVSQFFGCILAFLENIPYYLRPCYFEAVISYLYKQCRLSLLNRLARNIHTSSPLVRSLAVSSVSFVGYVPNADLAPLPPSLRLEDEHPSSIAAGLPHFAVGIWRNWGRDTFIALPGCLLATGRYHDARNVILSYAGALRHGLIPNLLAEGKGARYNCRDAVWFWLYSIERYVREAPKGHEILHYPVRRIYPHDDTVFGEDHREEPLINVIVEALQRHFSGIDFRERNAGPEIDEHMRDEGFNVKVFVDRATGFIHGGNRWNCGTWMDKMGSSDKAGNRGEPATPRDGAAVEIQALAYKILQSMSEWVNAGFIDKSGVSSGDESWTWSEWAEKIKKNFEEQFYIGEEHNSENFVENVEPVSKYVNRKNILKDTVGSSLEFTDYQLRCNYVVALAVAPTLIDCHKAWHALDMAREHLLGPLGMKTLDPSDWAYNGDYNNNDDGLNKITAKGWNYHQGPEWVWIAGAYLRARMSVGRVLGGDHWKSAQKEIQQRLGNYYRHIRESAWSSLPELTNSNGSNCGGSCLAQAWSVGCVLDACLYFTELTAESN